MADTSWSNDRLGTDTSWTGRTEPTRWLDYLLDGASANVKDEDSDNIIIYAKSGYQEVGTTEWVTRPTI